jgi:methylmalonyl-CoA mutase
MTSIPDFASVAFEDATLTSSAAQKAEPWLTPEGIAVKASYGSDDRAGLDFLDTYPGIAPFLRGPYPTMYVNQP